MAQVTLNGKIVPFPTVSPNIGGVLTKVRCLVLHSTGGAFNGAVSWLKNPAARVSAHFVVSRSGKIVQLVPLERVAYHAGTSTWGGKVGVNGFSIGIEMEHLDGKQDWPTAQLTAVAALVKWLCKRYHLSTDAITTHAAVGRPVGRKIDPYLFPLEQFRDMVEEATI
jgi:N-acetyl-anhydromuramyl-L-alanine amidase AmpD